MRILQEILPSSTIKGALFVGPTWMYFTILLVMEKLMGWKHLDSWGSLGFEKEIEYKNLCVSFCYKGIRYILFSKLHLGIEMKI